MRIAILNWTSRPAGGVGSYLRLVIPALARREHDIAFWHELGERPDGDPFALPAGSPSWSVEQIGVERALGELGAWRPHVLVSHGLIDPAVEARTLEISPAVFLAHAYYGTCISGAKMFKSPTNMPCSRTFGWPCLAHYYPRRCGGWSPITMVREFRRQAAPFAPALSIQGADCLFDPLAARVRPSWPPCDVRGPASGIRATLCRRP